MDKTIQIILQHRQREPVSLPEGARPRLKRLPGIRAVVFDVYGTLFSSGVGDISLADKQNRDATMADVLQRSGAKFRRSPESDVMDGLLKKTILQHQERRRQEGVQFPEVEIRSVWKDLIQQLRQDGLLENTEGIELESLVVDFESRVNPVQPMPELEPVLEKLVQGNNILSIVSNAQFYTPLLFRAFLGKDLPELGFCEACAVWSYRLLEAKPSVKLYQLAAEKLMAHHGISPEESLYVGNDMLNDMLPAANAGFHTALFAGDARSLRRREHLPECQQLEPDLEITHLGQILECV